MRKSTLLRRRYCGITHTHTHTHTHSQACRHTHTHRHRHTPSFTRCRKPRESRLAAGVHGPLPPDRGLPCAGPKVGFPLGQMSYAGVRRLASPADSPSIVVVLLFFPSLLIASRRWLLLFFAALLLHHHHLLLLLLLAVVAVVVFALLAEPNDLRSISVLFCFVLGKRSCFFFIISMETRSSKTRAPPRTRSPKWSPWRPTDCIIPWRPND